MPRTLLVVVLATIGCAAIRTNAQIAVRNQGYIPYSDAPINYRSDDLSDPVARLQQQIEQGKASLQYEPQHGYLKSVLKLLQVPIDSQTLVFSKTSFQYPKISPEHPRALYFNDDVYVGSVHEGKAVEIVSFDPMQGAIFYLLDERKSEQPRFQRAELDCTQCHIAAGTRGVPGVLLRSIYPSTSGTQVPGTRSFITDQDSPFNERWGGWYITGALPGAGMLASVPNMGNAAIDDSKVADTSNPDATGTKLTALPPRFDASSYLAPTSDVVAHLVLAHQTQMHNLITLTNYKTRLALYAHAAEAKGEDASSDASLPESVRERFEHPAEQLLRYLLFANETPLPAAALRTGADHPQTTAGDHGTAADNRHGAAGDPQTAADTQRGAADSQRVLVSSAFAREFQSRGLRDSKGRSLRDFDLRTRIFRYPCSYLIYSDAFDRLPGPAKEYVYHRLFAVLSGQDQSPDFARLSAQDRRAILEILLATKAGLSAEWQQYAKSEHLQVATARPRSNSQG
jgi:hypothetical protein